MNTVIVNNNHLLSVAVEAAHAAGKKARELFARPHEVSKKGRRDVVTEADFAAQQIITEMILDAFPDHGFLPEEEDASLPDTGPVIWVIDPIDGTVNYSRGIPLFCVSIAALRETPSPGVEDVLAAVIYDPMLDETFTATANGPALLEGAGMHGRALHVTNTDRISDAIIGVDWALEDEPRRQGTAFNARVAGEALVLRGLGTAALAMAWVAAGRLDAYINHQLKPWDVAAAALLVKQAGGVTGDISGRPLSFDRDGLSCLLTNSQLQELLAAVAV